MTESGKKQPRFVSWQDYGIDKARYEELRKIVKSGKYDDMVLSAAREADERAARHIIRSAKKELSYEHIEFDKELGRCALGRTNFYGARRLFFHCLNKKLRNSQA